MSDEHYKSVSCEKCGKWASMCDCDEDQAHSLHRIVGLLLQEQSVYQIMKEREEVLGDARHWSRYYHAEEVLKHIEGVLHYLDGDFGEHIDNTVAVIRSESYQPNND